MASVQKWLLLLSLSLHIGKRRCKDFFSLQLRVVICHDLHKKQYSMEHKSVFLSGPQKKLDSHLTRFDAFVLNFIDLLYIYPRECSIWTRIQYIYIYIFYLPRLFDVCVIFWNANTFHPAKIFHFKYLIDPARKKKYSPSEKRSGRANSIAASILK